ncbi:MAG: insulinase family protein, partial [Planctomycetaceae bacterium]|nr:insulinase family protein [Planctomycetaceae bacterium]
MTQQIHSFQLSNGLSVVIEPMPGLQSAAMSLLIPAGSVRDPHDRQGTAAILTEMLSRGAGGMSTRELSSALDNLGLQRNVSVATTHISVSAATTADRLCQAIPIVSQMVCAPHLEDTEFDPARDMVHQSLMAAEDEPRQQLGKALRRSSYPAPWGNPSEGEISQLDVITADDVRGHFHQFLRPGNAILGIAGNVEVAQIQETVSAAFGDWETAEVPEIVSGQQGPPRHHLHHESAQTHIGIAWQAVPYRHERYFEAWAAVSLLSGGMSSRLFTEVREKRGLCYAISASLNTLREDGRVFAYAGTTNERAQETLDVTMAEILRLHEGITEAELDRCRARAKSSLIMQQESTMSRASS